MYFKARLALLLVLFLMFIGDGTDGLLCNRCDDPTPPVANGDFVTNGNRIVANLECEPGYDLIGEETIHCVRKEWSCPNGKCQGLSGTNFVTVFPRTVIQEGDNTRRLMVTASGVPTNVSISIEGNTEWFTVTDFTVRDYLTNITLTDSDAIKDKVLVITSSLPIMVHTLVYSSTAQFQSLGSFINLPIADLSTEYMLITTKKDSQYNVIAVEDNTTVTMDVVSGQPAEVRTLNKYQVYSVLFEEDDLTGKTITSDKPVVLISGGAFARVPDADKGSRDLNVVQLKGEEDWKQLCVMGPFKPRDGFQFKVLARENNTELKLTINGVTTTEYLDRAGVYTRLLLPTVTNTAVVESDKPTLVAQFSLNSLVGDDNMEADSSLLLCIPPDEFLAVYRFFAPEDHRDSYVRIVIRSAYKDDLRLNGSPLAPFDQVNNVLVPGGGDSYDMLYIEVVPNTYYKLETGGEVFGADLYGIQGFGPTQYAHTLGRQTS